MKTIDPPALLESDSQTECVILDVLPEETFEKRHIPNALNARVYEIEFSRKVESLIPDKNRAVVVYGQNNLFEAAPLAYEKLVSYGWTNVGILNGGFDAWKKLGYPVEGNGEAREPLSGVFEASAERSVVRWIGQNLLNQHKGVIGLKSAAMELEIRIWENLRSARQTCCQ